MTYTNNRHIEDWYDGRPAYRVEGSGEPLPDAIAVEHHANDEWTLWLAPPDRATTLHHVFWAHGWGDMPRLRDQPCGCPDCDDSVQPGHFACSCISEQAKTLETLGLASRAYDDGAWRWFAA